MAPKHSLVAGRQMPRRKVYWFHLDNRSDETRRRVTRTFEGESVQLLLFCDATRSESVGEWVLLCILLVPTCVHHRFLAKVPILSVIQRSLSSHSVSFSLCNRLTQLFTTKTQNRCLASILWVYPTSRSKPTSSHFPDLAQRKFPTITLSTIHRCICSSTLSTYIPIWVIHSLILRIGEPEGKSRNMRPRKSRPEREVRFSDRIYGMFTKNEKKKKRKGKKPGWYPVNQDNQIFTSIFTFKHDEMKEHSWANTWNDVFSFMFCRELKRYLSFSLLFCLSVPDWVQQTSS